MWCQHLVSELNGDWCRLRLWLSACGSRNLSRTAIDDDAKDCWQQKRKYWAEPKASIGECGSGIGQGVEHGAEQPHADETDYPGAEAKVTGVEVKPNAEAN